MKRVLMGLVVILAIGAVGILAMMVIAPTEFGVEREVVINKPKSEVFAYAKILKNQQEWGPWVKRDPNVKLEQEGEDGTVGYISKWDSESDEVGTGEQEITKIEEGKRIDYEIRFKKPFEAKSDSWLGFEEESADSTKVTWGFKGNMPIPWNVMTLFIDMEEAVGKDFDEGLASLKKILEAQKSESDEKAPENEESKDESESKDS